MIERGDLRKTLLLNDQNGHERVGDADEAALHRYCEEYKSFLDAGRTERACVANAVRLAEESGFVRYRPGMPVKQGDKLYFETRGKAFFLARIGRLPVAEGVNIVAAHIDSPRLDLRARPLYEEKELAYLRTHYYGWVRRYQWVAIPLMLQGVIALKDGTVIDVSIGRGDEPKLVITDLLPHLACEHNQKKLEEAHTGEMMNILVGSRPLAGDEGADRVKLHVLQLLHEAYGVTEADLCSAELEAIPAFPVSDVGLDRSMIGAYGHDDRVCAYAALRGLIDADSCDKTALCVLVDKEEVGNNGVSGMKGAAFDYFLEGLCAAQGGDWRACYSNSFCLSADVTSAFDPNYADAFQQNNTAHINRGLAICKFTGFKGKEAASDASAELVARMRRVFDENGVLWQTAEMGRIDLGGGGTVALEMANRNIDTLDAGVPVLSMHSPFETVSKLDCYMAYKGYRALYES